MIKYILATMLLCSTAMSDTIKPQTIKEFKKTSVRIYNVDMNSGGSGSIFRSYTTGSHILTNKHVCEVVHEGGFVVTNDAKKYVVTHYKEFKHHDLCLIRVAANLNVNLEIASLLSEPTNVVYVSGHPNLLPHILTKGHLSDEMSINVMTGVRPCEEADFKDRGLECLFLGGIPVTEKYETNVISNLIKPGSSGSAVFNSRGEIVGLVFASGSREASYGFIVPHIFVLYFIQNAQRYDWVKPKKKVNKKQKNKSAFKFCKTYKTDLSVLALCDRR